MKNRKLIFTAILVLLVLVVVIVEIRSRSVGPGAIVDEIREEQKLDTSGGIVSESEIVFVVNKDSIPALENPNFSSVQSADPYLSDDGRGISVSLNGVTKFYPYQILVWHEVVNDVIGGTPIVVSYCPLCSTGIVYSRQVDNEVMDFGVSGKLWNSNLLMYDQDTGSLWSQVLGKAITGERSGDELSQLPMRIMTWKEWKTRYPNGITLSRDTGYSRDYTRDPYLGYDEKRNIMFPVANRDDRLHPKELVYGYVGPDGESKAYPEEYILKEGQIVDSVDGRRVEINYSSRNGIQAIGENSSGSEIDLILKPTFWFAWVAFFPETGLYDPLGELERVENETE